MAGGVPQMRDAPDGFYFEIQVEPAAAFVITMIPAQHEQFKKRHLFV
jgi:hypothetical protein